MDLTETSNESSDVSSNKGEQLPCDFEGCLKKFTKNRKLQNHLKLHRGERPFVCDVENCSKAYTNSSHLQRHKKTRHAERSAPILCPADGCGRELANKNSLKKHMYRWHDPQRSYPFMCGECQQGFYRKKQLQQHTYLHSGELPFRCDQCDAKFITTGERNKHSRRHRKYACECGEVSERWTSLLAHKKICKLRSLQCTICDKKFSNKPNLKMHINTHLNMDERQIFICPYDECERYYFYKTNLTVHINGFHKKIAKPKIPCTYEGCTQLLSRMSNYKNHLKTHEVTNKPKFPRKPRKDKGIRKKNIIDELVILPQTGNDTVNANKQDS